jgi:hypothetical protein
VDNFNVGSDQSRRLGFTICQRRSNRRRCGDSDARERVGLDEIVLGAQRWTIRVQDTLGNLTTEQLDDQTLCADMHFAVRDSKTAKLWSHVPVVRKRRRCSHVISQVEL